MHSVSELLVRAADLAEAEGRELRASTLRIAMAIGVIFAAAALGTGGLALLLVALYIVVADNLGAPAGAALVGAAALAVGGGLAWLARRIVT